MPDDEENDSSGHPEPAATSTSTWADDVYSSLDPTTSSGDDD